MSNPRLTVILTGKSEENGNRRAFVTYSENAIELLEAVRLFDAFCEVWEDSKLATLKDVEDFFSREMGWSMKPVVCNHQKVIGAYAIA